MCITCVRAPVCIVTLSRVFVTLSLWIPATDSPCMPTQHSSSTSVSTSTDLEASNTSGTPAFCGGAPPSRYSVVACSCMSSIWRTDTTWGWFSCVQRSTPELAWYPSAPSLRLTPSSQRWISLIWRACSVETPLVSVSVQCFECVMVLAA
jgi:hypothetical protein